jgi:hypothetical protein
MPFVRSSGSGTTEQGTTTPQEKLTSLSATPKPDTAPSRKFSKWAWAAILLVAFGLAYAAWSMRDSLLSDNTSAKQPPPRSMSSTGPTLPSAEQTLKRIADHLEKQPAEKRPLLRFLTLAHYPENDAGDAPIYHKAIAAWAAAMNLPVPTDVDPGRTILVIDLSAWQWEAGDWTKVIKAYPYGLVPPEEEVGLTAQRRRIREATGEKLSYVRADWFVVFGLSSIDKAVKQAPEQVAAAATHFARPLNLAAAAAELGWSDPMRLQSAIRANPRLRDLGLTPLADGGKIERRFWEKTDGGISIFQQTAAELGIGTPYLGF